MTHSKGDTWDRHGVSYHKLINKLIKAQIDHRALSANHLPAQTRDEGPSFTHKPNFAPTPPKSSLISGFPVKRLTSEIMRHSFKSPSFSYSEY